MKTVLITEPEYFDSSSRKILSNSGRVIAKRFSRRELESRIGDAEALIVKIETHVDKRLLDKAKKLRVIGSASISLDHIDIDYAKSRNVKIVNLQGIHITPAAEYAFGMILSLSRKIPWAFENMKRGRWERYRFIGSQLQGKTLGIIGFGRIGRQVADYAKIFGMKVIYYDPYFKSETTKSVSLNRLVHDSDIVTVHAMLTKETENMIDYKQLKMMKNNALLINIARAKIINTEALLDALRKGVIAGAAIDVFEIEPLAEANNSILKYARQNDNLLLTPHIGASAIEATHEAGVEIAKRVCEILEEK